MAPKKRKSRNTALKEEETPTIAFELTHEELEKRIKETEEISKTDKNENELDKGEKLKQNINVIKEKKGVIGCILRNSSTASIDLKDPTKIIDYAVLSSSALETGEELSNTFGLGKVKHVLVEGATVKFLSFTDKESRVSVFMENNVDHNRIYKDLTG